MRMRIRHTTRFGYEQPAQASFNQVRLTPRHDENQNLLSFSLITSPLTRPTSWVDHFGTLVHAFSVRPPHLELVVVSESEVVSSARYQPDDSASLMSELGTDEMRDSYAEWLHSSPLTRDGPQLASFLSELRESVGGERDRDQLRVRALVEAVCGYVHDSLSYVPGSTFVHTTIAEIVERRRGVCQDFAHLSIAALRALGVPTRYVSGYFQPRKGNLPIDTPVEVQSHAWISVYIPDFGWWEYDPTNACPADPRHVVVANGRDYGDIAPVRGVHQGGKGATLDVQVEIVVPSTPPALPDGPVRLGGAGTVGRGRSARLPASAVRRAAAQAQQAQ